MSDREGLRADEVQPGDVILWCDRLAIVREVLSDNRGRGHGRKRTGRRFRVLVEGQIKVLHYFDNESVSVDGS